MSAKAIIVILLLGIAFTAEIPIRSESGIELAAAKQTDAQKAAAAQKAKNDAAAKNQTPAQKAAAAKKLAAEKKAAAAQKAKKDAAAKKAAAAQKVIADKKAPFETNSAWKTCVLGTHYRDGKCESNSWECAKYATNSCTECQFWMWGQNSETQGNYCQNKWWYWVVIFLGLLLLVALIVASVMFCMRKKGYQELEGERLHVSGYEEWQFR